MTDLLRVAFLASHNGSSMRRIIQALDDNTIRGSAQVVISNNSKSPALEYGSRAGISSYCVNAQRLFGFETPDAAIAALITEHRANLLVLSGYMRLVGPLTIAAIQGRALNIHPALLPKFGGKGMFGMNVHRAVIAARERTTGITIHMVDIEYDHGPTVLQREFPVFPEDTPETLAKRLSTIEPDLFVEALQKIQSEITKECAQ